MHTSVIGIQIQIKVFFRNVNAMTRRYFGTAIYAVNSLVFEVVTNKSIHAGSEITSSLHMKSRPSVVMQCDETL